MNHEDNGKGTSTSLSGCDRIRRRALAEIAGQTSADTVVVASAFTARKTFADRFALSLGQEDVGRLAGVVRPLEARRLNLVLHAGGGVLEAVGEGMFLLRSRYEHIQAIVPHSALSGAALMACACDEILMPAEAVLGPVDDAVFLPVSGMAARNWMAHHCLLPGRAQRIDAVAGLFASEDSPRGPISASVAENRGLPVRVLDEQDPVHRHVGRLFGAVQDTLRERSLVRLVENHQGNAVFVQG